MKALWYVTKRSFVNRAVKALNKPATYLIILVIVLYAFIFGGLAVSWRISGILVSENALVTILTGLAFFSFFSNFVIYAKKKGIIFKPSHAHFIFTAPVNPKLILLMGALRNYTLSFLLMLAAFAAELYVFRIGFVRAFILTILMFFLEVLFEGGLIVFLYANEKLQEKTTKLLCRLIYVFLLGIVLVGVFYFRKNGVSAESVIQFVDYPVIQMIPVVGWNISVYRLILLGATTLNVVCSVLYFMTVAGMVFVAWKMKCTGEYYEDAAKFADDYAEFYKRSKSGEMVFAVGQKKKFKKAGKVEYKGGGAKAVFYRQLQEYKKERFFIFGGMTLTALIVDVFAVRFYSRPDSVPAEIVLLGIIAYITFCATGYTGKWEKELKSPYLYLIPDTPLRKMWYATVMEHIRSALDGMILCIPVGIAWGIPAAITAMCVIIYVLLQANKLYMRVLAESLIGNTMGTTGRQFVHMLFQSAVLGMGAAFAAVAGILINMNLVFPILIIYCILVVVLVMLLSAARFGEMEQPG